MEKKDLEKLSLEEAKAEIGALYEKLDENEATYKANLDEKEKANNELKAINEELLKKNARLKLSQPRNESEENEEKDETITLEKIAKNLNR